MGGSWGGGAHRGGLADNGGALERVGGMAAGPGESDSPSGRAGASPQGPLVSVFSVDASRRILLAASTVGSGQKGGAG
jgi:hypothetical protein